MAKMVARSYNPDLMHANFSTSVRKRLLPSNSTSDQCVLDAFHLSFYQTGVETFASVDGFGGVDVPIDLSRLSILCLSVGTFRSQRKITAVVTIQKIFMTDFLK